MNQIHKELKRIRHGIRRRVPLSWQLALRNAGNRLKCHRTALPDPLQILWIDPNLIASSGRMFNHLSEIGRIVNGDWDMRRTAIDNIPIYIGLRERFRDGLPWQETRYFQIFTKRFAGQDQQSVWGYTNMAQFEQRLTFLDELYRSIRDEGYRTQQGSDGLIHDPVRHQGKGLQHIVTHEVGCNIDRSGAFLLNSGIHRFTIAKLLGLDQIPIQIIVRHQQWQTVRNQVASGQQNIVLPEGVSLDHPDLTDCRK